MQLPGKVTLNMKPVLFDMYIHIFNILNQQEEMRFFMFFCNFARFHTLEKATSYARKIRYDKTKWI